MDASTSPLALPTYPAGSGLHEFALFVNFFFPALAFLVVSVRVAGRVAAAQLAVDDWLVCIAMLMSVAETVVSYFFIKTNFIGIPPERIPPHDPTPGLIWTYAVQILYNPILALVKSSVLIFLNRLFGQKTWIRQFLLWLNVVNISQMVAVFFAILLQCTPVAFNWDPTIPGGYCVDRRVLYTSTAVFNIVMDILILGLPLWIFSKLRIPKRTKIALLIIFLLGFLVTITSIVRLVLLVQGLFMVPIFPNSDPTNVGFVTSGIETNLALITASAPALRPIFRSRERGGWFSRTVVDTVATTRGGPDTYTTKDDPFDPDVEKGIEDQRPFGWGSDKETWGFSKSSPSSTWPRATKYGRGGSRGGRKGSSSRRRRNSSSSSSGGSMSSRPRSRSRSQSRTRLTRARTGSSSSNKIKPAIKLIRNVEPDAGNTLPQPQAQPPNAPSTSAEEPRRQARTAAGEGKVSFDANNVRVSDIQREIDGIVKDIAAAGKGTYTGIAGSTMSSSVDTTTSTTSSRLPTIPTKPAPPPLPPLPPPQQPSPDSVNRPTTPKTPRTPRTPQPRPSIETVTVGMTQVTPLPPKSSRPGTSASMRSMRTGLTLNTNVAVNSTAAANTNSPETASTSATTPGGATGSLRSATTIAATPSEKEQRYYSMSVYDQPTRDTFITTSRPVVSTVPKEDDDDWFDEDVRVSRYLDRRFGVVTPKGTTPTARGWEGSGRPF